MNCPKCGNELRISKKNPAYGLCDTCRKKFKLPEEPSAQDETDDEYDELLEHRPEGGLRYANIPPKHVREKREREMRQAYDELLAIGKEEKKGRFSLFGRKK